MHNTQMYDAFARIHNPPPNIKAALIRCVRRESKLGWSTNLSYRTYHSLKNQGVLS